MILHSNVVRRLFRFLHDEGLRFCVIGESNVAGDTVRLVVENWALPGMSPRFVRFAHLEDALLIRYAASQGAYTGKLAWNAEGKPQYLGFEVAGDLFASGVRILRGRELLSECLSALDRSGKPTGYFVPPPAADFIYLLLDSLNGAALDSERMEQASLRFSEDPKGARRVLAQQFGAGEVGLIEQAMENHDWEALRKAQPKLKRWPALKSLPRRAMMKLKGVLERPRRMLVACIGPQGSGRAIVIERIATALAPAFALYSPPSRPETSVNHAEPNSLGRAMMMSKSARYLVREFATLAVLKFRTRFLGQTIIMSPSSNVLAAADSRAMPRPDLWIVLDAPPEKLQARKNEVMHAESSRERDECLSWVAAKENSVVLDAGQPLERVAAEAIAAILELASERTIARARFSGAGVNRFGARLLLFCCRYRIPFLSGFVRTLFNSEIDCAIRFPVRLPYPFGIFIHANAEIGSGVTIMQQVTVGVKALDDTAAPVIEDEVSIGAGAKVLGAIRVGRGATIGASAVVTRNVPKLATVAGVNDILHAPPPPPGEQTLRLIASIKAGENLDLSMEPERRKVNHDV
ncbi:MAG: serine acetyltransferase [Burkholderiales bacterium]